MCTTINAHMGCWINLLCFCSPTAELCSLSSPSMRSTPWKEQFPHPSGFVHHLCYVKLNNLAAHLWQDFSSIPQEINRKRRWIDTPPKNWYWHDHLYSCIIDFRLNWGQKEDLGSHKTNIRISSRKRCNLFNDSNVVNSSSGTIRTFWSIRSNWSKWTLLQAIPWKYEEHCFSILVCGLRRVQLFEQLLCNSDSPDNKMDGRWS